MSELHTLYRFYDRAGELLYVGITNNPPRRFGDHRQGKDWWAQVGSIDMEHHSSRDELRAAERHAIAREAPLYNVQWNEARHKGDELVWICDVCGGAVEDGHGYLTVSFAEIARARSAAATSTADAAWTPINLGALPPPAVWLVLHGKCDPNPLTHAYWYDVERVRTTSELLLRTAHMVGKPWLRFTTWGDILRRATA